MEGTVSDRQNAQHVEEKLARDAKSKDILEPARVPTHNIDLTDLLGKNKPEIWGQGYIHLYLCCLLMYLCSTMNGYDGSLMSSINSLTTYQKHYNLPENGASATGIVFSVYQIGQMGGALFVWTADWKGRKIPIFVGCLGVVVATVITATARDIPTFTGGRFLLSFFATIAQTAAPLLLIEIAPPLYRGTVAGLYNTFYYMGAIIATFCIYGTHRNLTGNIQWRLPLWLQMLCPGIVCLGIYFVPESPRWLVGKERYEQARDIIIKYHANGDADHPIVQFEMEEMMISTREQGLLTWRDYYNIGSLLKTRARRYRMMLNISMSWFGQFSGNNIASYYLPLLIANVGVTDESTVLLLNAIYQLMGWIAAASGARFHDVVGRRKMLLGSALGMAACLAIVAGTAAGYVHNPSNKPMSSASIAFIYIFGCVFACAFTSMQPIYPGEVLSNDMRAKGMAIFQLTAGCAGFVNTFAAPIALKNIGYWFYVFFVFWDLFEAGYVTFLFFRRNRFIYLFFVETKGRTLEELDAVFESKNPVKASLKPVVRRYDGAMPGKGEED